MGGREVDKVKWVVDFIRAKANVFASNFELLFNNRECVCVCVCAGKFSVGNSFFPHVNSSTYWES